MATSAAAVSSGSRSDARSSVAPFADILGFGTLEQKQELIGMIANEFQPTFAPTLRLALTDPNNAIRVQAASAITRVEDEFLQQSLALADEVRRHPGDARRIHALAAYHDAYASAGILDVDRARDSRQTARTAYLDYLQLQPLDHVTRAAVGRLLVQDGRYQDAADWLVEAIAAPEGRVHALLLWMEAQFNLGRFAEVRWAAVTHAKELIDREDTPLLARETLKLWAGAA
jgi:tetratricopeptide (TPR) repeat protein